MMDNVHKLNIINIKKEKKLLSSLKFGLSNKYVDTKSNKFFDKSQININYSVNDDSFWFSRASKEYGHAIYYFGLNIYDLQPNCIIQFDESEYFSTIIFKDNLVKLKIKINDNSPDVIKKLEDEFNLEVNRRLKRQGIYYIVLGDITQKNILDNFKKFVESFIFEVSSKTTKLVIKDIAHDEIVNEYEVFSENSNKKFDDDIEQHDSEKVEKNIKFNLVDSNNFTSDSLNLIKTNLEVFNLVNYINGSNLSDILKNNLIKYLFSIDENKNYHFNIRLFNNQVSNRNLIKIIENAVDFINENYVGVKLDLGLKLFKNKLNDEIKVYYNDIKKPDSFKEDYEIFKIKPTISKHNNPEKTKLLIHDTDDLNELQKVLFDKYLDFNEDLYFKNFLIPTYEASQKDVFLIFENIKQGIIDGKITPEDDLESIIEDYFENYFSNSNYDEMINYCNNLKNDKLFIHDLKARYPNVSELDIEDIELKVKSDIESLNLNKNEIKYRFEVYFEKKSLEIEYKLELEEKSQIKGDFIKFGLKSEDLDSIFSIIYQKIDNWHDNWSIFDKPLTDIIEFEINLKLNEIRSETRVKFESMYPDKNVVRGILFDYNYSDDYYTDLINLIYDDIYLVIIRSKDVDDNLLINYFTKLLNEGVNYD